MNAGTIRACGLSEVRVVDVGVNQGLFKPSSSSFELSFLHLLPCRRADSPWVYTLVLYIQSSTRCCRPFFVVTYLFAFFIDHDVIQVIDLTTSSCLWSYIDYLIIPCAMDRVDHPSVCSKLALLNDYSSCECQLTLITQQMPPILVYVHRNQLNRLSSLLLQHKNMTTVSRIWQLGATPRISLPNDDSEGNIRSEAHLRKLAEGVAIATSKECATSCKVQLDCHVDFGYRGVPKTQAVRVYTCKPTPLLRLLRYFESQCARASR